MSSLCLLNKSYQGMTRKYRRLTTKEITQLAVQRCISDNWKDIQVTEGFTPDNVAGVRFRGKIKLGDNRAVITNIDGIERKCGIYNAELINCTIGNNVLIANIGTYIANYDIEDNVYIESVGKIVCTGQSTFGNGVMSCPINEGGGREMPLCDLMSAQNAYLTTMYRHRPQLIKRMYTMIEKYCSKIRSDRGRIEEGARLTGCNTLRDIYVGSHAVISGATVLTNGTLNSSKESPAYIGAGVKAHDFICLNGAKIDNGAALNRCFIGEACHIDYGYTVTDSLFFSNCECANGEACSIFAGPYTVSHHKSSLLIAGYFSFFNAGSGANQSNHLFKTGAVHQGIHERGCKFASNAYVMLPAREGAFTVILGRHVQHHNTEDFPFSYLVEEEGKSYLIPGINLRSYGTLRDIAKWRKRDKRGSLKRDRINFEEYNPYLGSHIANALTLSRRMLTKEGIDIYNHQRLRIKAVMLRRGMHLYQLALDACIGDILSKGCTARREADREWIDAAGMYVPKNIMERIITRIESGEIATLEALEKQFVEADCEYQNYAYAWALDMLEEILGHKPTKADIVQAISKGSIAAETLHAMRTDDAQHDADATMMTGYGIDSSDPEEIQADFKAVRGLE